MKSYIYEITGTFAFVFFGCGAILFALPFIGYLGISLAFGLAYTTTSLAFPHQHFNPAVTIACAISKQFYGKNIGFTVLKTIGYILSQIAGALLAVAILHFIYSGKTGYVYQETILSNQIERYTQQATFCIEFVLSFLLVCCYLGTNNKNINQALSCGGVIIIGYLMSYPITKGAMNPAKATATALFESSAIPDLLVFWTAPLFAAIIAGVAYYPFKFKEKEA